MEERCCWFFCNTRIAIRCPSCDSFEKREHTAYSRDSVECGDEMHLAGAGICKTGIDSTIDERAHQAFGSIHGDLLRYFLTFRLLRRTELFTITISNLWHIQCLE